MLAADAGSDPGRALLTSLTCWIACYNVSVFRIALVVVAVLALVAGLAELNVRETAPSTYVAGGLGGCGSVIQGSTFDDGGASPDECRKKRHHDTTIALELFVIAVAAGSTGIGLMIYKARSRRRKTAS
jgi:hypothetical protein